MGVAHRLRLRSSSFPQWSTHTAAGIQTSRSGGGERSGPRRNGSGLPRTRALCFGEQLASYQFFCNDKTIKCWLGASRTWRSIGQAVSAVPILKSRSFGGLPRSRLLNGGRMSSICRPPICRLSRKRLRSYQALACCMPRACASNRLLPGVEGCAAATRHRAPVVSTFSFQFWASVVGIYL